MGRFEKIVSAVPLSLMVVTLSACGGGGGGDETPVTNDNQPESNTSQSSGGNGNIEKSVINSETAKSIATNLLVAIDQSDSGSDQNSRQSEKIQSPSLAKAVSEISVPCDYSGSFRFTVDDADNNKVPSKSDSITMSYDNCQDIEGETIYDGSVIIRNADETGDRENNVYPWRWETELVYDELSTIDGDYSETVDGLIAIKFSSEDGIVDTGKVTYQDFSVNNSDEENFGFSSLVMQVDFNNSTDEATLYMDGDVLSDGESLVFSTINPLRMIGSSFPYTGKIVATANDSSSLTITVLSESSVQLDVDEDGDGNIDDTLLVDWDELDNSVI